MGNENNYKKTVLLQSEKRIKDYFSNIKAERLYRKLRIKRKNIKNNKSIKTMYF